MMDDRARELLHDESPSGASRGLAAVQLELYTERSERRKLEEEVTRLQCALGEAKSTNNVLEATLATSRHECADMEQLFLEQRRRCSELESSLKRNEVLAIETETLRSNLVECRQKLLNMEREAFENNLNRSTEEYTLRAQIHSGAKAEMYYSQMIHALEVSEADRRLAIMSDALHGTLEIASVVSARVSHYFRQSTDRAIKVEEYRTSRAEDAWRDREQGYIKSIAEVKALVSNADRRTEEAYASLQKERNVSQDLRKELRDAKERIQSLLLIPSVDGSRRPVSPPRNMSPFRSSLYSRIEQNLLSPNSGAGGSQMESLKQHVRLLEAENETLRRSARMSSPLEGRGEVEMLRERIRSLENAQHQTSGGGVNGFEMEQLRKEAREMSNLLTKRQEQLVIMAQKASDAEKEMSKYKELSISLQRRLQQSADVSATASMEKENAISDLTRQVQSLSRQLRERSAHSASPIAPTGFDVSTNAAANRRLEMAISEMAELKAESVALRAQLAFAKSAESGVRSTQPSSPNRHPPQEHSMLRSLSPVRPSAAAQSVLITADSDLVSPWKSADNKLLAEIKGLAHRNAYLEAVLSEQNEAKAARRQAASRSPGKGLVTPRMEAGPTPRLDEPGKAHVHTVTLSMSKPQTSVHTPSRSVFFENGASPQPAPSLGSTHTSPNRQPGNRRPSASGWTPDAPVSTVTVKRRKELPGGNHFETSVTR